ncbi:RICIN domain-containing protein [Actinoplanes sp. NPDC049265]|uniref:RICIN domain-containing protein n=1 Tax=Actinoplanes sp. NPDC049265 TaxID=3363902 RepID=UPI0037182951
MKASAIVRGRPWRRLLSSTRRRVEIVALVVIILSSGGVAFEMAATADPDTLKGEPVPASDVAAVVESALSCPSLNPSKVAAQIMAASGFKGNADTVAGLDKTAWDKWRPSSDANRGDRRANIVALGHRTCENVGQLRAAGFDGDLWPTAVAAERGGLKSVLAAHGIPKDTKTYVDKVKGYAAWYSEQPQFSAKAGTPSADPKAADAVEVPEDLVQPIQAAGRMCKEITPARIAAQLRAVSGFDVNRRTADRQGVAQFTPAMWARYEPGADTSVWRPADAIPALGVAMCDMTQQLSHLNGDDPYRMALGAYQWGIDAVRRADGLPRVNVSQLADVVPAHVAEYDKDKRLNAPAPKPSAAPSTSKPAKPEPSAKPEAGKPDEQKPADEKPKGPKLFAYDPNAKYQIWNAWADAIVELPGINENTKPGSRVHMWKNEKYDDQYWKLQPAPDKKHVIIANAWNNMALAVEDGSTQENAKMAVYARDDNDENQQWLLEDVGAGRVVMTNRHSGRVMELLGEDLGPPKDNGTTWNGYWVEQLSRHDNQRDQKWRFVKQ